MKIVCLTTENRLESVEQLKKMGVELEISMEHTKLKLQKIDVLLTYGYPRIIPMETIHSARYAINCHPTLLPEYRGIGAVNYSLRNGDKYGGVTVHFLDEGVDTGDIILQKQMSLSQFDTPSTMNSKLRQLEPIAIYEALKLIENDSVIRHKQGEPKFRGKTKLTPEDSIIPERLLPYKTEFFNHLRSCADDRYPAFMIIEGKKVSVTIHFEER